MLEVSMKPAIELARLSKSYRVYNNPLSQLKDQLGLPVSRNSYFQNDVLKDVSLKIQKGERVSIIGRNGAGKSTLLKIILGRTQASAGRVSIDGQLQALLSIGVGFDNNLTAIQNIRQGLTLNGISSSQHEKYIHEVLEFAELSSYASTPVKYFSAGMYTRLAFAVSTCIQPDILIIDEVLGAGDISFIEKCSNRIRKLCSREGSTLLLVSHSSASVLELTDRCIYLKDGRIAFDGDPLDAIKLYENDIRYHAEMNCFASEMGCHASDLINLDNSQALIQVPDKCASLICSGQSLFVDTGNAWYECLDLDQTDCSTALGIKSDDSGSPVLFRCNLKETAFQDVVDEQIASFIGLKVFFEKTFYNTALYECRAFCFISLINRPPLGFPNKESFESLGNAEFGEEAPISASYGSKQVGIDKLRMFKSDGTESRLFVLGESLGISFDYICYESLSRATFCVCIYKSDGSPGCQVIASAQQLNASLDLGRHSLSLYFDPVRLGEGSYMASIGIFDEYDLANEAENRSFLVLDRELIFEIQQPIFLRKKIGIFAHSVSWKTDTTTFHYDPATLHSSLEFRK